MNKPAITLAVFKNNKRTNDKAPQKTGVLEFNEDVTFKAGTKLDVSLWERTSKGGMPFESGVAKPQFQPQGNTGPRNRGAEERSSVDINW